MKKEKHFNTSQFWRFGSLFLVISISLVIALISFSCRLGLGGEIDMVGPELRITSHENLDFDKPNFILSGTAIDNVKVTRIEGLVTASNSSENTETKTFSASINGENWFADLNLPEGEQTIEVVAYDKNNNTSHLSKKVITLLIDATPPFVESLELVRPNFRGNPLTKEVLKTKDPNSSQDLNIFHNEDLRFEASIKEDFNMQNLALNIHDEEGNIVLTLENSGSNDKAPMFKLTQEVLTTANPEYSSGLHYFRITMEGYDMAENSIDAHNTDQFLWFAWYAGADYPHIEQGQAKENGHTEIPVIEIPVGNSLSFNFWDDDAIESIYLKKIETSDWNAVSGSNDTDKLSYLEGNKTDRETLLGQALSTNSGQGYGQIFSTQLSAGTVPGEYRIVAMVQDKKDDPNKEAKWTSRVYRLLVSDENAPITFIEEPAQNTVPTVNPTGDFEIKGYTIDNVGTDTLLMAWIPFGSNISQEVAKDALKESTITAGSSTTLSNGLVIYNISLGTSSNQNIGGIQYKKKEFTLSLNIFESFKYKGTSQNQEKNFVFLAKDGHGNEVFQSLKLLADTAPPKITIHSPDGDLKVHNIENDLELSFSAIKASGLSIPTMEIWDCTDSSDPEEPIVRKTGDTASITILKDDLSESRRTYRFIAKDALGNEAFEQATIIISSLPTLQYISSNAANRTYKAEDSIILTAKFSKAVKVTGRPRLRIRYSASDTTEKYATYTSGSGTDTLLFTWKVPSGAVSSDLRSHSTPIDLNGGSIQTTEGSGGSAFIAGLDGQSEFTDTDSLQGRKNLVIDGVSPTFESLTFPGAKSAYKAEESFTATLRLSEQVLVSGSPELQFIGNNNSTLTASFQRVSGKEIYFTFTVKKDQNATNLSYNSSSFISEEDLELITDLAGNSLTLSGSSTNTGIIIDTNPPEAPTVTGIDDGKTYNTVRTITLSKLETGATVKYSLNGGLSWDDYPSTGVRVEDDGNYTFIAYQMDAAGNRSLNVGPISFEVDCASPILTAVSCDTPDGSYGIGETLRFKLFFSEKVKTNGSGATITLNDTETVEVKPNTTGAASLEFVYKIVEGDNFKPVKITSVNLENITDLNGNAATNPTTVPSLDRPNLHADAVKPIVSSRSPGINAVAESRNTLVIEFNENIFVEQGVIEIARAGNWYLPLYLEEEEFKSIYNSSALDDDDRAILMISNPATHYLTGQALGPYKETTHGLKNVGGNAVPDTSTKYVLDFPFSSAGTEEVIYQLSANTTRKITGAQIREVLEKAGYHKHSIDVGSTAVTIENKRVTATIPVDLAIGREWTVTIPAGAFRDAAGNTNDVISWNFWTDQVATPVIRVERYSHGEGAIEPHVEDGLTYDGGILQTTAPTFGTSRTVGARDNTTAPSGYVRVRIDCETPGATIQFGAIQHTHPEVTPPQGAISNEEYTGDSPDIVYSTLTGLTRGATYSNIFALGDGILNTAGKYYVAASATKANSGEQGPALTQSATGIEGAFKSIIHYRNPGSGGSYLRFQGSNIQGGVPTIAGFPLRDADPDLRFTKHAYNTGNTEKDWYWHSWEIVCDWYNQSARTNWQNPPNYPLNKYGNWLFINAKTYHGGGTWTDGM